MLLASSVAAGRRMGTGHVCTPGSPPEPHIPQLAKPCATAKHICLKHVHMSGFRKSGFVEYKLSLLILAGQNPPLTSVRVLGTQAEDPGS